MSAEETVKDPYRVFVVVDREYGERLAALPSDEPVWVIDSPANTPVAERLDQERTGSYLTGVTRFMPGPKPSPEEALLSILEDINEHHTTFADIEDVNAAPGVGAPKRSYTILNVIGCPPSEAIYAALALTDFVIETVTANGFVAVYVDGEAHNIPT